MTLPVPNQSAYVADVRGPNNQIIGRAYLTSPWNNWFQQFSQPAPEAVTAQSPYTPNAHGTLILNGSGSIILARGKLNIPLAGASVIIPMGIGDTVSWSGGTAIFLGA